MILLGRESQINVEFAARIVTLSNEPDNTAAKVSG
jgi:hypothetical protein